MTTPQKTVLQKLGLYDQDFYLWIETTAKQLKEGRFSDIVIKMQENKPVMKLVCPLILFP